MREYGRVNRARRSSRGPELTRFVGGWMWHFEAFDREGQLVRGGIGILCHFDGIIGDDTGPNRSIKTEIKETKEGAHFPI